jgi:pilus assembly protein FimV
MVIKTLASVAVISALGLLTSMQAFGQGNITTSSALNEPFKAEIAVTAIRGNEAGNLQVRLASLVSPNDEPLLEGGELSPMGSDKLSKLSEQLTLAQEKIEGQAQENIDIKSRMDVMEEQMQSLRRLISLKDADLARLQSSLEQGEQVEVDDTLALLEEQDTQLNTEENIDDQSQTEMTELGQYFASIGQDEPTENVIVGIDLSAIPSVDEVIAYTLNLLDMDISKANSLLAEVKIFVAEHKKETMSGALLFLLILWLLVRRRNRPDMALDEAVEKLDDSESVIAPPRYDNTTKGNDKSDEMLVEEIGEDNTSEEIITDIQEETIEETTENSDLDTGSNELEFDLSDFDEVDEAETKLDLAAAYIDLGDPYGAKSILDEVLNEGNEEQKLRAQAMLTDLS